MSAELSRIYDYKDDTAFYLSQLYTLYSPQIVWPDQLKDLGYKAFPDPKFEGDDQVYKPDMVAYSDYGDVQYIDVLHIGDKSQIDDIEARISSDMAQMEAYSSISDEMLNEYLSHHGEEVDPQINELVALVTEELYSDYRETIKRESSNSDIIVWEIKSGDFSEIVKREGKHANLDLDDAIDQGATPYPNSSEVLLVTRDTDISVIKYEFSRQLITYCARENKQEFEFSEVDEMLIQKEPPILWQLTEHERRGYWQQCLHTLLNRFSLIEQSGRNTYRWKPKAFINEPRHQKSIIDDIREGLGL